MYQSLCLPSTCLPACPPTCLSVCLSIIYLSVHPSICLLLCISICLSNCQTSYIHLFDSFSPKLLHKKKPLRTKRELLILLLFAGVLIEAKIFPCYSLRQKGREVMTPVWSCQLWDLDNSAVVTIMTSHNEIVTTA
jgi:hypothetical protein